jgi:phosphotriesterase-related protein
MKKRITTVLGDIAVGKLGFTSMHEHIMLDGRVYRHQWGHLLPENPPVKEDEAVSLENIGLLSRNFVMAWDALVMDDEETMLAELLDFKASGGAAMVEMSTPGLRSNLPAIQRVSEKSGVHVVATTGLYTEYSWPSKFQEMNLQQYMNYMLHEIEDGIENTGIKPGHIKVAVTDLSEQQEKVLRAAARVSIETNLSVTVHPGFGIGSDGRRIVKILAEEGMALDRVIIAHAESFVIQGDLKNLILNPETWRLNLDYCEDLIQQGANFSFDGFGHYWDFEAAGWVIENDWQRLAAVVALVKAGYSSHILLGTDTYLKILTRRGGGTGYCRLPDFVIRMLRDLNISDYDIRQMTVENPARLLAY